MRTLFMVELGVLALAVYLMLGDSCQTTQFSIAVSTGVFASALLLTALRDMAILTLPLERQTYKPLILA